MEIRKDFDPTAVGIIPRRIGAGKDLRTVKLSGGSEKIGSILDAIGNTPLVGLRRFFPENRFNLFAKLEGLNPGGSIKDRAALRMLQGAWDEGRIDRGTTIIESSSGNMAIGLAQACLLFGIKFICVIDKLATRQNLEILRTYGAKLEIVDEPDAETGEFVVARLNRVRALLSAHENSHWLDQYSNEYNYLAHYETMGEIAMALNGRVDHLVCATSTCGTLKGCSEYIADHGLRTRVIAVDAIGSAISGGPQAKRLIPGHGSGKQPAHFVPGMADSWIQVSDADCVLGCRRLVAREALLGGGSSGGIMSAIMRVSESVGDGESCIAILPDRGERYLETIYSDEWVRVNLGILQDGE